MKTLSFFNSFSATKKVGVSLAAVATLFFASCDNDDNPDPINEEEVITRMTITLTPPAGDVITMISNDSDGVGPGAPVVTVSGNLQGNVTYSGSIELLNTIENPAEDITLEVLEEADEHQFFFVTTGSISGVTATNFDSMNNPLGQTFDLTTGTAGSASLRVVLRHEPTKPNTGLDNAGGETDIDQTFDLLITN